MWQNIGVRRTFWSCRTCCKGTATRQIAYWWRPPPPLEVFFVDKGDHESWMGALNNFLIIDKAQLRNIYIIYQKYTDSITNLQRGSGLKIMGLFFCTPNLYLEFIINKYPSMTIKTVSIVLAQTSIKINWKFSMAKH